MFRTSCIYVFYKQPVSVTKSSLYKWFLGIVFDGYKQTYFLDWGYLGTYHSCMLASFHPLLSQCPFAEVLPKHHHWPTQKITYIFYSY